MLKKLNKIFTKDFIAICAAILALFYVFYDIYSFAIMNQGSNYLYYLADLFLIILLILLGYYSFRGKTRKASKLFYIIGGFTLGYSSLFSYSSMDIGITFILDSSLHNGIGYGMELFLYGLGSLLVAVGIGLFLAYKLGNKKRMWLAYISLVTMFLTFIICLTGFCFGIVAMLETDQTSIIKLFDNINTGLLAIIFMAHCVLSLNRTDDFDETNLKEIENL